MSMAVITKLWQSEAYALESETFALKDEDQAAGKCWSCLDGLFSGTEYHHQFPIYTLYP
jgi:hypothetical protein